LGDYFYPQCSQRTGIEKIPQRRIKMEENNAENFWANLETKSDSEEIKKALEENPDTVEKW
jgi:hypothetical protein